MLPTVPHIRLEVASGIPLVPRAHEEQPFFTGQAQAGLLDGALRPEPEGFGVGADEYLRGLGSACRLIPTRHDAAEHRVFGSKRQEYLPDVAPVVAYVAAK